MSLIADIHETLVASSWGSLANLSLWLGAVATGLLATMIMDVVGLLGFKLGVAGQGPRRQGPEFIGRWIGYLGRSRFRHADILLAPPLRGEFVLGTIMHYTTGITLAVPFIGMLRVTGITSTLLAALIYGVGTVVFAWFLYFPAIGAGWMGRIVSPNMRMALTSLLAHAVYGVGLAIGARLFLPF